MILSKKEVRELINLIGRTKDVEIDCEACLDNVAEFAEYQLAGKSLPVGLRLVEQHLSVCTECREEFVALRYLLRNMDE